MILVLLRCNTENLLQRMDHLVLLHAARLQDNTAILHTTGSLHDHMIADLHLIILRIKIINLTNVTKSDSNYLSILFLPNCQEQELQGKFEINIGTETHLRLLQCLKDFSIFS